ncbi:beta-ketoacyl-[acyl-carrier-protein] synthase family protein [Cesiribacter sp. SM1]|uniref:beta-ketoacyl-[acyl-carrier-protein] synthase family protein n=1 Tax=Cesiribacter sp. SM1 TaxID=2861196 RepID=UPI001CD57F58|nr:beta-ketoacyl-[acyl-carrier-protein] synthase family protein [Cesiribacter sp. SM1]
MAARVFVTGWGIISALGRGVEANLAALKGGRTGIAHPEHLKTLHKHELVTGEVKAANSQLAAWAGVSPASEISRTALLGLLAAAEAADSAGLSQQELKTAGLINGTSVGGMDISEQHYEALLKGESLDYHRAFAGHDCGISTEFMAERLGIKGHLSTISTACSSSANAIMQAGRLIRAGAAQRVLAGGTDALAVFTLNGFNSLKILDPAWCRPFDVNRMGLNLGEGAAYLVLESEESAAKRGAKVLAELIGWGNTNDAYHQTASSPEGKGAYLAMKKALEVGGREGLQIDYVNAHGTGTANNDLSESMALQAMFGEQLPDYSSTKSYTGHTLGAAGGIEAVFSLLAINHNLKFPNLNLGQPMDVLPSAPLQKLHAGSRVDTVLSNSFGFGGNCTSLLFTR